METAVVLLIVALVYGGVWRMVSEMVAWEVQIQRALIQHHGLDGAEEEAIDVGHVSTLAAVIDVY